MHPNKKALIEMFLDKTPGESTQYNRLVTTEEDDGTVSLLAYGWLKLATYNERRGIVTVFTGHKALNSVTVSKYLNQVTSTAVERDREVLLSGESPTEDTPNEGTRFIGNYVSMDGSHSSVEEEAVSTVRESLEAAA
jgi:hypothetical protein